MRKLLIILFFCPIFLIAQKPFINSISPGNVEFGETVTITGSNLSGTPRVFFGSVEASAVNVISDNLIEATVPFGATQSSIYVLNNNLITQSSQHFFISFVGSDITNYDSEYDDIATTEQAASEICLCDLDSDGKNDIVIVHLIETNSNEVAIFRNNTSGTGALTGPTDFQLDQKLNNSVNQTGFNSVYCADLDNDGDKDLAFTSNLGTNPRDIYVYENVSTVGTISLNELNITQLVLPNTQAGDQRSPRSIQAADMDGDGKADLVVGNNTDATFHVFRNTSSGSIAFAAAAEITANGEPTGILEVADFNNDSYLDVVTLTFRESNSSIHFFKNTSATGQFNFIHQETVTNSGQNTDVTVGDLDNDGLNDVVVASNLSGLLTFFENQSSNGQIIFGGSNNISITGTSATGVSLADLNGDGLLDIATANGAGNIYVFENTTSGAISFGNEQVLPTASTTSYIVTGDLNSDAKADLAYTQNVGSSQIGNLGIILNRNCVQPQLSPAPNEGGVFCSNPETFTLTATASPGATYDWTVSGNTNAGGNSFSTGTTNSATFDLTSNSTTTIQVTINQDATCAAQSDTEVYTIAASVTGNPTIDISQAGVLCAGDNVTLSTTPTFENYFWTLPDGSTQTSSTIQLNPVSTSDAGIYSLRVQNSGSCSSSEVSINVEVSQPPLLEILNNNLDDFCIGTNVSLEVQDFTGDFTYEWQLEGTDFGAGNVASISTNQGGNYTVEVTDVNTCVTESASYTINSIALPTSVANGPTETCIDFLTSFTSASTGQGSFTLQYEWIVEDATNAVIHTATTQDLDFTFPTTGDFDVILNTNYDPSEVYAGPSPTDLCVSSDQITVTVSAAPSMAFNISDGAQKCQAETININLTSPVSTSISTHSWSLRNAVASPNDTLISNNLSTSSNIDLTIPIGVDSVYAILSITTTIGCDVIDSVKVRNFPSNADISSPDVDASSDLITLEDDNFVRLSADGLTNVNWEPVDIFDNPTAIDVTAFPDQPSTTIIVTGTDDNNCTVSSQLTLTLDNLRPKRTFSPNGDGLNDCWEILNSSQPNTEGCKIYVFDARGKNIKVADAPFTNNCVWDGNFNGSPVPEGVYYYVLKCNDNQMSKSGSILLAR
ncbi:FG-GAP-like repeat-containing protein [Ekhidna sp.]|uniref:FG-GAP-like repeat-containing protein n=1 Tax=Ekhidna sp. TaxID=2608089 RepID=UPI003299744B